MLANILVNLVIVSKLIQHGLWNFDFVYRLVNKEKLWKI